VIVNEREIFLDAMRRMDLLPEKKGSETSYDKHSEPRPAEKEMDADRLLFLQALNRMEVPEKEYAAVSARPTRIKLAHNRIVRVQDEIDLHGQRAEEAVSSLHSFVLAHFRRGTSSLLIITGKGKNSPHRSVLKPRVRSWITTDGSPFIQSWAVAPRIQGGDGAFVLYLKKRNRT
jgi:DNA-nicking Smr family endonuclease